MLVCISTVAEARYIEVNEAYLRTTGHRREEVLLGQGRDLVVALLLAQPVHPALEGVEPARPHEARAVHMTRLNAHYRPALALARAVLDGVNFETRAGPRSVTGLTVDMNRLFEKFLRHPLPCSCRPHFAAHPCKRVSGEVALRSLPAAEGGTFHFNRCKLLLCDGLAFDDRMTPLHF